MLKHALMGIHRHGRRTIRQRVNTISRLVRRPHGTLNATIGKQPSNNDILDTSLTQQKVEIGRIEAAETRFSLDDDISGKWGHGGMEFGCPVSILERASVFDSVEDSKVCVNFRCSLKRWDSIAVVDFVMYYVYDGRQSNFGIFE